MGKAGACDTGRRKFTRRVLVPAQVVSTMVLTTALEAAPHPPSIQAHTFLVPSLPSSLFLLDGEKRNSLPQIPTL